LSVCVNYDNPKDIAKAANFLVVNPIIACDMGASGRRLVKQKYNWVRLFYNDSYDSKKTTSCHVK